MASFQPISLEMLRNHPDPSFSTSPAARNPMFSYVLSVGISPSPLLPRKKGPYLLLGVLHQPPNTSPSPQDCRALLQTILYTPLKLAFQNENLMSLPFSNPSMAPMPSSAF